VTARLHVVLLAGGTGSRFWPMSRASRPKHMLRLFGAKSLLEAAWERARVLAPASRIWVVVPRSLRRAVERQLPGLRPERTIVEATSKGTAAAFGLAARNVAAADPKAVVAVLPTDHVVDDAKGFARSVRQAAEASADGGIVCLGVRPDRPSTGFGYLEVGRRSGPGGASPVRRFVEKPKADRARAFARSGRHLWNVGVVVAGARTILDALARHAPSIHRAATGGPAAWAKAPARSFDRAVLEKVDGLRVVPLASRWTDVGSWDAAAALASSRRGRAAVSVGSPGSVVFGDGRVVALVDVPGVVVVDTPDAVLVVSRRSAEKVRDLVAKLARERPKVLR